MSEFDDIAADLSGSPPPAGTNNPGGMRPPGASTGFQRYATPEAGIAAIDGNLQAYGKKGIKTIADVVRRWAPPSENNTQAYISDVARRVGIPADQEIDLSNPMQRHALTTAIMLHEQGPKAIFGKTVAPSSAPVSLSSPATSAPASEYDSIVSDLSAPAQEPLVVEINGASNSKGYPRTPAPTQETSSISRLGHSAVGLADTVLGGVGAAIHNVDYAARRAFQQSPEAATAGAANDGIGTFFESPVSKVVQGLTGADIRNTAGYQGEASQRLMQFVSENLDKGAAWIAQHTGLPAADVSNMIQTGFLIAPKLIKDGARIAGQGLVETAASDMADFPKAKPTAYEQARATYNQPEPMQQRQMSGGGAAAVNSNPYPIFRDEEAARGEFPVIKLSKSASNVSAEEQAIRSRAVQEVNPNGAVRTGVMTGNENDLRNEHTMAAVANPTPEGLVLKQQIADEQRALSGYSSARVDATGASPRLINDEQRGRAINDAVYGRDDSLTSHLEEAKNYVYDEAERISAGNPIQTAGVDAHLSDPVTLATAKLGKNEGVLNGAADLINLAKTVGFRNPVTGKMYGPNTVGAFREVRKALNARWTPENKGVIRDVNAALDDDVALSGGSELYKLGDKIHQAEKVTLGSKGIGSLLGPYDENGVKTGSALESIPGKLNSLPNDQWQHLHDVLDDLSKGRVRGAPEGMPAVPGAVRAAAERALKEMHGSLAREVYGAGGGKVGVWNQNSVNKVMNSTAGDKILQNFPPDEVANFHWLNLAGQIMPGVHSYEGAALQGIRAKEAGLLEKHAAKAGAVAGAAVGATVGPITSGIAAYGGEHLGGKISSSEAMKRQVQAAFDQKKRMEANANKGKP